MSYIIRSGNLTATPTLRTNDTGRHYCFARVAVNDRAKNTEGEWETVGTTFYDLTVSGSDATRLIEVAEASGNVRVVFAGRYSVREYKRKDGTMGTGHNVHVDEIGISLRGQAVHVISSTPRTDTPPETDDDWREYAEY